jgi:hypothetical protein
MALGAVSPAGARAGELTLIATPRTSCGAGQSDPFDVLSTGPASYFSFRCTTGGFELDADVASPATAWQYVEGQINAPPGITITSATTTGSVYYSNAGWYGGSYFYGGGTPWPSSANMSDPSFSSSYWGYQVICTAPSCGGAGRIDLTSVKLTATESQRPSLTPAGSGTLWFQTRPGEWIWNPPHDPWPLTLAASDPSGVCSLRANVGSQALTGPSAAQNTSAWQQCPDPTWTGSADTSGDVTGPLPLSISAVNAAGLGTSESETLHVDNQPVDIALSTSNDSSSSIWANHPVTVFATATTGPSGLGGMTCSVGSASPQTYTARGVTVDGDGVHTVVCTAWNNAQGPQGQPNSTTSSVAVHVDESPPSIRFEPQQPGDPTGVVVDTSDSESGVAGGSIQIAPAGGGSLATVPTSFDGAHLLAHLNDAGLHGPYTVRATSCDNVGNCATTSETLMMPLRLPAAEDVGFAKIGTPAKLVRERVLVGFHYKHERRRGKMVNVRVGGHYRIIRIVIPANTRCGSKLVKTGPHLWQETTVCRSLGLHPVTTKLVPHGKAFTIHGLLVTTQGVPVGNARVDILTAPANGLGQFTEAETVMTSPSGAWTATLPAGPSRIIQTVYDGSATVLPAAGQATVNVPARIALSVSRRTIPWDGIVTLRGHLQGGYVPHDGVALRLLIKLPHRSQPYEPVPFRTDARGDFTVHWSWGAGSGVVTYPLAVATTATESDYPFAASRSRWIPVTFGIP